MSDVTNLSLPGSRPVNDLKRFKLCDSLVQSVPQPTSKPALKHSVPVAAKIDCLRARERKEHCFDVMGAHCARALAILTIQ